MSTERNYTRHKKIALALSGGGLKLFTHVGVIKVLEENNIPIDFIAGTSAGAFVGGVYAFLKDIKKIEEMCLSFNSKNFLPLFRPSLKRGFIKWQKVRDFLDRILKGATFKDLKIDFRATAVDLETGKLVVLSEGDLNTAILASCSIPLVFEPVVRDGKILADGGLRNPLPINVAKEAGADVIIAVNLKNSSYVKRKFKKKNGFRAIGWYLEIMQDALAENIISEADVVINPGFANTELRSQRALVGKTIKNMIAEGEKSARLALPEIKRVIGINEAAD